MNTGGFLAARFASRRWLDFRIRFTVPQTLALTLFLVAAFLLRSKTLLAFTEAARFFVFALLSVVPLGAATVQLFLPDLHGRSERAALIGITGYASSVTFGFLLGAVGLQWLYLPLCLGALLLWLAQLYLKAPVEGGPLRRIIAITSFRSVWTSQSPWLLGIIALLSVLVTMPLLAPRVRAMSDLTHDYSFIDQHYHLTHAVMFLHGAPLRTWPALAGTKPLVYPDFHNFWMGQLAAWSHADIDRVFYVYAPIAMIVLNTLLLYAFGKSVTGSPWGGCIGAALGYVLLVPNPYEPNVFLSDVEGPPWILARTHFLELASGAVYGVGWQLLTGVALCVSLVASKQTFRTQVGALTVATILLTSLVRIRPHYFVAAAPPLFILIAWLLNKRRDLHLLLPVGVFALLFGAVFLESTSRHYNTSTLDLGLAYGPEGDLLIKYYLPQTFVTWVVRLPVFIMPIAAITLYILLRLTGTAIVLILAYGFCHVIRKTWRPGPVDYYLWAVLGLTIAASAVIVKPAFVEVGGNWGTQALFIVPRIMLLLAVVPLYELLRRLHRSSPWLQVHSGHFALASLLFFSVVAYRGASATLHQQATRAYPSSAAELSVYDWIRANTPVDTVVAANPAHVVNRRGETIRDTHFLGAMTHRPVYLEKEEYPNSLHAPEVAKRRDILQQLFAATTPAHVRELASSTNIDLILIYPDTPTMVDFSCCMKLVYGDTLKVYEVFNAKR